MTVRTTLTRDQEAYTQADIDAIRFEVARVDVMADVAMEHFERTVWREADAAQVDVAHLIAATAEAASAALLAVDDLRRAVVRRRAALHR